jgi:tetratricopeptide (TPR) repeat protein
VRLALALALAALLPTAMAAAQPSREQALRDLGAGEAETRRQAVEVLRERGTMSDLPALVQALRDSDPVVRALAEGALWTVWSRSDDPEADQLLALGIEQMRSQQGQAAIDTFSELIRRKPDFAEGWNKRATVYFLMGEFTKSLADCDEVMKRNPYHYGALSGYGMIYMQLGQPDRALGYLERALAINPNLREVEETVQMLRRLLIERRKDTT